MKQKINKQAGNCAGLYLLRDDSAEPAWRGRAPHQTMGQRRVRGDRPRRRLFSDGFFLVPAKPWKVSVAVPNSRAPSHAGGGHWGERETLCVPRRRPSAVGRAGLGCVLEVAIVTLTVAVLRGWRSHLSPAPVMLHGH